MTNRLATRTRLALAAAIASTLALLFVIDPATSSLLPPCPWRFATGWLCPGCGSARALHAMLHGDLQSAFALNPLAAMMVPVGTVDYALRLAGRPSDWASRLKPGVIRALLLALAAFTIARNVTGA